MSEGANAAPRRVLRLSGSHGKAAPPWFARGTSTTAAHSGGPTLASGDNSVQPAGGLPERYASALYSLASDQSALDEVVGQVEQLGRLIDQSEDFRRLLASPLIDVHTAQQAARAVLGAEGFGKLVQDFVGVVAANRRLAALPAIVRAFNALVADKRGIVVARVETAHPLSDVQEQQLRARLIEAGYGNVNIVKTVDPGLLGGIVVRIGARLYDSSLRSRLQRLQYAMKGAA
ncbi:MAG: F0F1 ATP synthase subunit delta [Acidisphaera sp.]|nr:F0F1 ATP synthase subunit delta [Acidisphaera sp.]